MSIPDTKKAHRNNSSETTQVAYRHDVGKLTYIKQLRRLAAFIIFGLSKQVIDDNKRNSANSERDQK